MIEKYPQLVALVNFRLDLYELITIDRFATTRYVYKMFLLLALALLLVLYIYVKLKYYTLRDGIPGVSPHLILGNLIQSGIIFNGATTAEVFPSLQRQFGDVFQFWLGSTHVIVVSGIGDVQHILTNRHVYDLGDIYAEKLGSLFPNSLMGIKGN